MKKKRFSQYAKFLEEQDKKTIVAISLTAFGLLLFIALAISIPAHNKGGITTDRSHAAAGAPPKGVDQDLYAWYNGTTLDTVGITGDFDDVKNLGATWLRYGIGVDRPDLGKTNYYPPTAIMDQVVSLANTRGINLEILLPISSDSAALTTFVNRYKSSVHYWEVGNEPNLESPVLSPTAYAIQLVNAKNAIKAADPAAVVLSAGLSEWQLLGDWGGPGWNSSWLKGFLDAGACRVVDVIPVHPYRQTVTDSYNRYWEIANAIHGYPGCETMPVWVNEIGFNTSGWNPNAVATEQAKADALTQLWTLFRNGGVPGPYIWYILHETGSTAPGFGLEVKDPTTHATTYLTAYTAYQNLWSGEAVNPVTTPTPTLTSTPTPAPSQKTATVSLNPASQSLTVGNTIPVVLTILGNGQAFNAAQATVSVSANLQLQSLTPGTCNISYTSGSAPTITNPSFAGAMINTSSTNCSVYTMGLKALTTGTGTITLSNNSVKAYTDSSEIFLSATGATYTITAVPTPTVTPTPGATSTPTPLPTVTPTPLPTVTPTPLPTATPTSLPTATPTPVLLIAPTFGGTPTDTYDSSLTIRGTRIAALTTIYVNNTTTGVGYPDLLSWTYSTNLVVGSNTFTVYGKNFTDVSSLSNSLTIKRHKQGDINGDGNIDLIDLSMLGADWGKSSGGLQYPLSDMNGDGIVDLTDFSIFAKVYGQ